MRRHRALLAGLASAILLSCGTPTGVCACPPARTHAVLYGTVRSAAGEPVAGAQVQATLFRSVCGEGYVESPDAAPAITDAGGTYRMHLFSVSGPQTVCAHVVAREAGAADSALVHAALTLRHEGAVPDSLRADLVLP